MRRSSVLEGINILLDGVHRDIVGCCSLSQECRVMDSLSAGGNLLASHEEVVAVSVVGVIRVQHSVEWTSIGWISIEHVEVSIVLFTNNSAKLLLIEGV